MAGSGSLAVAASPTTTIRPQWRLTRARDVMVGSVTDLGVSFHLRFIAACSNSNWGRVSQVLSGKAWDIASMNRRRKMGALL